MIICRKAHGKAGDRKRIPKQYGEAHAAWHKRGKRTRRVRVRSAKTAENLRLSRARRKTKHGKT